MTREIRQIETNDELEQFARVQLNAYPAMTTPLDELVKNFGRLQEEDDASSLWGLWEDGQFIGGMRLLDFNMNYRGTFMRAGGLGSLAVDLVHKKKKAARDMVNFYLDRCQKRAQSVALLYPFRPDFYYRMGFGYGTKMNQYRFEPSSLPRCDEREGLVYLGEGDAEAIKTCHEQYAEATHGWCRLSDYELQGLIRKYAKKQRMIGYWRGGELRGYLTFGFKRAHDNNFVLNDMEIGEWIVLDPHAFRVLAGFVQRQADQVDRIIYSTQDEGFHHAIKDVRSDSRNMLPPVYHESNTAGVGLMYRIISFEDFLAQISERNFGGVTLDLTIQIEDSFRPQNSRAYHVRFDCGKASRVQGPFTRGVTLRANVADLSALFMGSIDFRTLYNYGQVEIDKPGEQSAVERLFAAKQKPRCITSF